MPHAEFSIGERPKCRYCGERVYAWQGDCGEAKFSIVLENGGHKNDWYHVTCAKIAQKLKNERGEICKCDRGKLLATKRQMTKIGYPFCPKCGKLLVENQT